MVKLCRSFFLIIGCQGPLKQVLSGKSPAGAGFEVLFESHSLLLIPKGNSHL